jgi:hypothetical protein
MTDAIDRAGEALRKLRPYRIRGLGWRPSLPDPNDHVLKLPGRAKLDDVPPAMDNSGDLPPCWDQGQTGSCTSYGTEAGIWQHRKRQGLPDLDASNRFTYYFSRLQLGPNYVTIDSGASVRGAMKVWATLGSCPEAAWPTPSEWSYAWAVRPPDEIVAQARGDILQGYQRVYAVAPGVVLSAAMRYAIAKKGGVVFGFPCHASFLSDETARTGIMPKPGTASADPIQGGHCTYAVGYDDQFIGANWPDTWRGAILVRNSWGTDWGDPKHPGHFWVSYHWINQRGTVSDCWVPEIVS